MKSITLGTNRHTGQRILVPKSAFSTHFHLIGGTGKGKTTALHTMMHQLLLDPVEHSCWFLFDRLGNFSQELLLWMASPFCTERVRNRLIYVEPGRDDVVLGFNPLLYENRNDGYYRVERATEIVLRAWESVNIEAMPRLARWVFNSFWAAAQLGLTIADCQHILMPGSPYHPLIIGQLPEQLRNEWSELFDSRSGDVLKTLDSSRNRLKPYFESDILRHMFGATQNRLDVQRFMREGRIVIFNLAPNNRLSSQLANTIGSLVLNEVLATARCLPRGVRYPTYLMLDEFQNFVGPDIQAALPEVRQLGIRLLLSHQSFSQLERGDYDLTSMIFQCQSRLIFGVQGEDADVLAHELASITYDPKKIKDELHSRKQRIAGHRVAHLTSSSESYATSEQSGTSHGENRSTNDGVSRKGYSEPETKSKGSSDGRSEQKSEGRGTTSTRSTSRNESLVPIHEDFIEVSSRTYFTFEEDKNVWAREIRNLPTGTALLRLVNEPKLLHIDVKRSAPAHLGWDMDMLARHFPKALDDVDRLLERNFKSDIFVSPDVIEAETKERLQRILQNQTAMQSPMGQTTGTAAPGPSIDPFQ